MNLLHDPWMPVRDAQGQRAWITPDRLAEPQWLAFDADRPDFNGALAQFAIGLLQTTTPVVDSIGWRGLFNAPPDADELQRWFEPVAVAFVLDGTGPRFMQDLALGVEVATENDIGALLIDSPGVKTVETNRDHFVKRGQNSALCPACAAIALFALQLNAPAGGQGHRTGLRGGGPLTTLVLGPPGGHLWHDLWMNVRDRNTFLSRGAGTKSTDLQLTFPWLGPISTIQAEEGELAPAQVHPAQVFWAMPRRIRLDCAALGQGRCACCDRASEALISRYRTKNHGLNYKGDWNHPLSPYYHQAKEGWLPLHPQPDGLGYKHWLAWVLGVANDKSATRPAQVVDRAISQLSHRQTGGLLRLWSFGYDMDNMKARCWYESTLPLYALADCDRQARQRIQAEVSRWLAAASMASTYLRGAVKDAWFSADARGEYAHVDAAFWSATEQPFYRHLKGLIEAARTAADHLDLEVREAWHARLVREAVQLFDQCFVGTGTVERQNPRRAALAFKRLRRNLHGPKLRQALGLPTDELPAKPARKSAKPKPQEGA